LGKDRVRGDGAAQGLFHETREVAQSRRVLEELCERLQSEWQDDATRLGRGEATIAAIEAAGTAEELDYAGQRQALSNLEVRVGSIRAGMSRLTAA
jgi:hypothetical protein